MYSFYQPNFATSDAGEIPRRYQIQWWWFSTSIMFKFKLQLWSLNYYGRISFPIPNRLEVGFHKMLRNLFPKKSTFGTLQCPEKWDGNSVSKSLFSLHRRKIRPFGTQAVVIFDRNLLEKCTTSSQTALLWCFFLFVFHLSHTFDLFSSDIFLLEASSYFLGLDETFYMFIFNIFWLI